MRAGGVTHSRGTGSKCADSAFLCLASDPWKFPALLLQFSEFHPTEKETSKCIPYISDDRVILCTLGNALIGSYLN